MIHLNDTVLFNNSIFFPWIIMFHLLLSFLRI